MACPDPPAKPFDMCFEHITAHFRGHPARLQEGVQDQTVKGSEQVFGRRHQLRPGNRPRGAVWGLARGDLLADDGGHGPVAPVRLCGQERPDSGSVPERQPGARVQGTFFVEGQEFAQQC